MPGYYASLRQQQLGVRVRPGASDRMQMMGFIYGTTDRTDGSLCPAHSDMCRPLQHDFK